MLFQPCLLFLNIQPANCRPSTLVETLFKINEIKFEADELHIFEDCTNSTLKGNVCVISSEYP